MAAVASVVRRRWALPRALVSLALALALLALALLVVAPLGWRAGLWSYRLSLGALLPSAAYCGLGAAAAGLVAAAVAWRAGLRRHAALAAAALLVGGAVFYVPWQYEQMRGRFAIINDITTDTEHPPQFVSAAAARKAAGANSAEYGGARVAEVQRRAYPDIAPVMLDLPAGEAFIHALAAAKYCGWTIVATDPVTGRIEALQKSRWFRFIDDIVVRVVPAEGGSRVDVRSSARLGRGDFGVNAARVRAFIANLRSRS